MKNQKDLSTLQKLQKLSIEDIWRGFLTAQTDLFFSKEFALFQDKDWWKKADSVLEIGSRDGGFSALLAKNAPEKSFFGLDQSADWASYANANFASDRSSFLIGSDQEFIPEFENRFSVVIFRMRLQHTQDPKKALLQAFRYLKPSGRVFIIDSYDPLRASSEATPVLDQAVCMLHEKNEQKKHPFREASFQVQKDVENVEDPLWSHFSIEETNLTQEGKRNPSAKDILIYSRSDGDLYLLYNLLFLQLLRRQWQVELDFDKAYEEAKRFCENKDSWMRSGKHYLILKKKTEKK